MDNRAKDIFLRSLDLEGTARQVFVQRECGEDRRVFEMVSELLRHHGTETILDVGRAGTSGTRQGSSLDRLRPLLTLLSVVGATRTRRWVTATVAAAAFLAAGWYVRSMAHELARSDALSVVRAVQGSSASFIRTKVAEWIRRSDAVLKSAAGREAAIAAIQAPGAENRARFAAVVQAASSGAEPDEFGLTNEQGRVVVDSGDRSGNLVLTGYGGSLLAGMVAKPHTIVRIPGIHRALENVPAEGTLMPMVVVLTPVVSEAGVFHGVYFQTRQLAEISDFMRLARVEMTGESYLFSRDGVMLTPSRFETDLAKWGILQKPKVAGGVPFVMLRDPGHPLRLTNGPERGEDPLTWPGTLAQRVAAAAAADSPKPREGAITEPYRDYRGERVVGAWRWMPELDAGLLTEMDEADVNRVANLIDRILLVLLGCTGLGGVWGFVTSGWLLRMRREIRHRSRMGPYTLVEKIGEGGMGEVYLARHPMLKRLSALKLLRRDRSDGESQALFENEVQTASHLMHPNTVEIYDYGRADDGTFYYVMQYLPGRDLSEWIRGAGAMPAARVVHIARQICGALAEAHEQGLLHRDVKPGNVMLCSMGGVLDFAKLLDFGIARRFGRAKKDTGLLPESGTPYYTAPELLTGEGRPDGRADLYSLGVLCFYLLTERLPQPAGYPWVEAVLTKAPSRVSSYVEVPAELEVLVMSCLEREAAKRPGSAVEVLEQLDRLAATMPWTNEDARRVWGSGQVEIEAV